MAVRSLDSARPLIEALFGSKATFETAGAEVRRLEWCPGRGGPTVELISPVDQDGAVARFIRKRGEGVHHVTFAVPDLEAAVARLTAAGARLVQRASDYRDAEGRPLKEVFLHPKEAHGVLIHLVEEE